jgi:putative colanic acid biosynthesis acetyltransferase WcaF
MGEVKLSKFENTGFYHGKGIIVRLLWILCSWLFFQCYLPYPSKLKSILLRMFGAKVGQSLVIRNSVIIKQPWMLNIGNFVWIGEAVWIDNLVPVVIGDNVCLSQGAMLLTGNHDYKSPTFDLITGQIHIANGAWIGAKCIVGPNVKCSTHSVLTAGSTTFKDLDAFGVYQGNPSVKIRHRQIIEKTFEKTIPDTEYRPHQKKQVS